MELLEIEIFRQLDCVLMVNWIVEMVLFICNKMDLALNKL